MKFEISNYRVNPKTGAIRGFFDLLVEDTIIINGFRICEGRNGEFVALPSVKKVVDGQEKWDETIRFVDKEEREKFCRQVLKDLNNQLTPKQSTKNKVNTQPDEALEGWT